MISKVKKSIAEHLLNLPGWRTKRKIIVFESDDWGSIRMTSKKAFEHFLKKGYPVDQNAYDKNDSLENNEDVEKLGEVLLSVTDKNGMPAKFTLNNNVANPDFQAIGKNKFENYKYEPFYKTLERYPASERVMNLYRQGIKEGVFKPQYHCREHVNVNRWMEALNKGDERFMDAFEAEMFTLPDKKRSSGRRDYLDSLGLGYEKQIESEANIIREGLQLFEEIWGYKSNTFMAPCYIWPSDIEPVLKRYGVRGLQGTRVQRVPKTGVELKISKKYHYTGQKNRHGQYYMVRNAFFEPAEQGRESIVEKTLQQIQRSFMYQKPAIIQSHRVNYIGSHKEENRSENLKLLSKLLNKIVHKYPDVEFLSSDELLNEMEG